MRRRRTSVLFSVLHAWVVHCLCERSSGISVGVCFDLWVYNMAPETQEHDHRIRDRGKITPATVDKGIKEAGARGTF